jgi:hypothetical protein
MLEEQTAYYLALLDKIEIYTDEAELTQRSFPDLDPDSQQWLQAEIWHRAQELQKELDWAEKTLAPQSSPKSFSRGLNSGFHLGRCQSANGH